MKDKAREGHLRRTYGISLEQYQELFDKQEGRCPVCMRHQDELKVRLAVDHNHKTKEIRGLMCQTCNHRVVGRHTDSSLLRRVADYLERTTGWFVPDKTKKKRRRRDRKKISPKG
jgi:uncharacterized protein YlaI